jgi:hypothetical protein
MALYIELDMSKERRKTMKHEPKPPFRVDRVDQFNGHCEEGYTTEKYYENIYEAISYAKWITKKAIKEAGSIGEWIGWGDAGLVYDRVGWLIWDGIEEFEPKGTPIEE